MDNKYEWIDIDKLKPYERNPRLNDQSVDLVAQSIEHYGFKNPILVDENYRVCAGHARLKAAKKLGMTEVPVLITYFKDENDFKGYNLIDNKSVEMAQWDNQQLVEILQELKQEDFNINLTGFDNKALDNIIQELQANEVKEGLIDDDEVPEVTETICKVGDLWELGRHRLLCADCTVKENIDKLMGGKKADMVFTDPPYGINLDTNYAEGIKTSMRTMRNYKEVMNDDKKFDAAFILEYFDYCNEIFLWGANYYSHSIPELLGSWFVWSKKEDIEHCTFGSTFELCWSKNKHRQEIIKVTWGGFFGFNKQEDGEKRVHPTQKPVKLVTSFFQKFEGNNVVDLFGGSGSTLIACEKTNRICYMMEIDPHYCDVIIKRWEDFTGLKVVKIS